jgi:hypothetical protein
MLAGSGRRIGGRVDLDSCFEDIAERGPERLGRSITRLPPP